MLACRGDSRPGRAGAAGPAGSGSGRAHPPL